MGTTRIKICGITNSEDACLAAQMGADFIGLNLYAGSKRCISPSLASDIVQTIRGKVEPVVLLVNEALESALTIAAPVTNTIQWHGDDPPLPPPAPWKFIVAFNVSDAASLGKAASYVDRCRAASRLPAYILLDGHAPGQYGGTGVSPPWKLIADFRPGVPVILAGGLTPDNVAEAIDVVKPFGVDVAGGVESAPGKKDPEKLRRFIEAVKSA